MLVITSGTEEQSALAKQLEDARSESGVDDAFVGSLSGSDGRFHVIIRERDFEWTLWDFTGGEAEIVAGFTTARLRWSLILALKDAGRIGSPLEADDP